jgi:hypothetical protein
MIPGMQLPVSRPGCRRLLRGWPVLFAAVALVAGCSLFRPVGPSLPVRRHVEVPTDQGIPAAAARALNQRFPWMHVIAHGSGRLQVDDADDLAVALAPAGQSHDVVVALLVNAGPADYRVGAVSQVIAPGCEQCSATVDISRHALFVHVTRAGDADYDSITWQFTYRDNGDADALRLVGVSAVQSAQRDDPIAHS